MYKELWCKKKKGNLVCVLEREKSSQQMIFNSMLSDKEITDVVMENY